MIDFIIHSNLTPWGHVWHIVTTDGKGMVSAEIDNEDENTFFIYGLSVTPDMRKRGIGTELLKAVEQLGKEINKKRFRINIDKPKNDWLYNFYIKQGYEFWDEDEQYIYLVKYNKE